MIPSGIGISAARFVGSNLGAKMPKRAKIYALMSIVISLFISIVWVYFLLIFRHQIAYLFTKHDNVAEIISVALPIVGVFELFDYLQCSTGGTIRAMGMQKYASYSNLISYWLIAMPLT